MRWQSSTLDDLEGLYCNENCVGCSASFLTTAELFCFFLCCRWMTNKVEYNNPYAYLSSRRWSCRSSCHVYTTATPRSPDFRRSSTADYSQCSVLPPDWFAGNVGANTSHLFCESFIGYGPESVSSTSNLPFSSCADYTVWRHAT